ncbi:MAG: hypothetical protein GWN77_01315 [Gammaproteobacteria bacterium]|nr:hypothetical protein [Gammaproteobacteria bacterium]
MENWNFRSWHVGLDVGGKNTNAITSENFLIAAGPARLSQVGDNFVGNVFPIGMLESVSIGQQKMLQQVREIGSRRSYIISSYATGNLAISRVMYSQASLLRVLTLANDDFDNLDNPPGAPIIGAFSGNVPADTADPALYINLQSELFDRPVGMLFYVLDQRNNPYGAFYAEECQIQTHNVALAAQGVSISEQASMVFDRLVPVSVSGG